MRGTLRRAYLSAPQASSPQNSRVLRRALTVAGFLPLVAPLALRQGPTRSDSCSLTHGHPDHDPGRSKPPFRASPQARLPHPRTAVPPASAIPLVSPKLQWDPGHDMQGQVLSQTIPGLGKD